ncbi:MAG: hypothetical protein ABSH48_13460 [Verrucomicrobiota bacterium]|jgi:hypothetical protein
MTKFSFTAHDRTAGQGKEVRGMTSNVADSKKHVNHLMDNTQTGKLAVMASMLRQQPAAICGWQKTNK